MRYIGSKNRIAKELKVVIQNYITEKTEGYIEPFVGGANLIDKIEHQNKIGCDIHPQLIALLNKAKTDLSAIPDEIIEAEYKNVKENKEKFDDWYVGLVGFCASFGAKYFGGYARDRKGTRNSSKESIRNLKKQAPLFKNITFINRAFQETPKDLKNHVIYCDIPYKGTTEYSTDKFPYDEFYVWAKEFSKENIVLISEYEMPDGFKCVWEKETKANFDSNRSNGSKRVEKLFIYGGDMQAM